MNQKQLKVLVTELVKRPNESEWVEFKHNFHSPEEIGETLSALANGACLHNQSHGYLVFGVQDKTHKIVGTTFKAKVHKKGNEELEMWLTNRLNPRIDFVSYEFDYDENMHISLYVVPAAHNRPVEFLHKPYIRINSNNMNLGEYPEKEGKIWRKGSNKPFEVEIAKSNVFSAEVVKYLDTQAYFDLLKIPYPTTQAAVVDKLLKEGLIVKNNSTYDITNLGALLFAKNLEDFEELSRKSIRVIVYRGRNKVETEREQIGKKGYAVGFSGLIDWVNSQLPANEEISKALRKDTRMYPEIAIRELIANAIIHQDFRERGFPMIEIFCDRIEISNPGLPLITPDRFIDEYISRNEKLADIMRRTGICEEKGSGLDKVIFENELYQLPAINIQITEKRTRVTIYSYKDLNHLDKKDKIRACYQHACLRYVSNDKMTNQSLRDRFRIEDQNAAIASRIIRDTLEDGMVKEDDPESNSRKYKKYIPFWA